MGAYSNTRTTSVLVTVVDGVAAALRFRFCKWKAGGEKHEVTAAGAGDPVCGVLAQNVATKLASGTYVAPAVAMAEHGHGVGLVELGEAVAAIGAPLKVGAAGVAMLADAAADEVVGYALETGAVGEVIEVDLKLGPTVA